MEAYGNLQLSVGTSGTMVTATLAPPFGVSGRGCSIHVTSKDWAVKVNGQAKRFCLRLVLKGAAREI